MKKLLFGSILLGFGFLAGCVTPDRYISDMRLGMTQDEVRYTMGDPFAIRASKLYEGEEWVEVWEYKAPIFSLASITEKYDTEYRVIFKNGKVIQWGQPGDMTYPSTISAGQGIPVFDPEEK